MGAIEIEKLFREAVIAHKEQNLDRAAGLYEEILTALPNHAGALANLGRIARARKDNKAALALYERAAEASDAPPEVHYNLGNVYLDIDNAKAAHAAYHRAIDKFPNFARAHEKLSHIEEQLEHLETAATHAEKSAQLSKNDARLFFRAAHLCERAGKIDKAVDLYRKAVSLKADYDEAATHLAQLLFRQAKGDEAVRLLQDILARDERNPTALQNLGFVYRSTGHYAKALDVFNRARKEAPERDILRVEAANCLVNLARAGEGRALLESMLETPQGRRVGASSYLMSLLYDANAKPAFIRNEHVRLTRDWKTGQCDESGTTTKQNRRLRVGYLTADFFGNHPVAQFIAPVISAHADPAYGIQSIAYDAKPRLDATASTMSSLCEVRSISALSDASAAALIEEDGLDLLIDLSGHTSGRRLPILGLRPAPVQACFIGYPSTTGFSGVDYLISDEMLIPHNVEKYYSEKIARLPNSFLCFQPPAGMPAPDRKQQDGVVFGSLNHLPKMNPAVFDAWADILIESPSSKLIMQCAAFAEPDTVAAIRRQFEKRKINPARLTLSGPQAFTQAMERYNEIDIALDPFPYNGGTTTCHALWMGTPVVTLAGDYFCGRMGASILTAASRPQWIAEAKTEYAEIAVELASDRDRLCETQQALKAEIASTPLCDKHCYAQSLVDLYREMTADA